MKSPTAARLSGAWLVTIALVASALGLTGTAPAQEILLRERPWDPLGPRSTPEGLEPGVPALADASEVLFAAESLHLVQFVGGSRSEWRTALEQAGGQIVGYMPRNAHVVRATTRAIASMESLPFVRWTGLLEPSWRMSRALRVELASEEAFAARECLVVLAGKQSARKPFTQLADRLGIVLTEPPHRGAVVRVALGADRRQLIALANSAWVLWIENAGEPGMDGNFTMDGGGGGGGGAGRSPSLAPLSPKPVDNARLQAGMDALEGATGFAGQGMRGHVYEGVEASHPDFNTPAVAVCAATPTNHGHAVAGILFGNGAVLSIARGMVPEAECLFTDVNTCALSRHDLYGQLVAQEAMFTVASFGSTFTSIDYRAASAAVDDAVFDHDIPAMQSQGNVGFQLSRPEAWAKNGISVGAVTHFENADPSDDSWFGSSLPASTGPSQEGRFKPDLCAYNDNVLTSDRTGNDGFFPGEINPVFNGTSAATPIVAGALALGMQMFADGAFGNAVAVPGGSCFENRPHFTTAKALAMESARQYAFDASSFDNRREHQGWGFPDVSQLWERRMRMLIIDETVALELGEQVDYILDVEPGEPELSMTMTWADPMGMPQAFEAQVNDLDLVAIAPDGTVYWGNHGLMSGTASVPGGVADDVDTVERLIIPDPLPGAWTVTVRAREVNQDARVETPGIDDVDFALVVSGAVLAPCVPAVVTREGVGCGGARLEVQGTFCQASRARVVVTVPAGAGTGGGSPSMVLVGSDAAMTSFGVPLPVDLGSLGAPGCSLRLDPFWALAAPDGLALQIPLDPALAGVVFTYQGVVFDAALNPLGLGLTDLIKVVSA